MEAVVSQRPRDGVRRRPPRRPLLFDGRAYVLSAFGELYCLDLKTGQTLWQKDFIKDLGGKKVPTWGYCCSPLVARGRLIVNPGGRSALVALDPQTGSVLWQGEGGLPNYSSFLVGTFGGVEQVVGYDAKTLGGWDLQTGRRLWNVKVESSGGYIVPSPLVLGGNLLIADTNNEAQLFAFDPGGTIRSTPVATNDGLNPEICTPVAAQGLILGQAGKLVCLDAASLKTLWSEQHDKAFEADCHLIAAEDRAVVTNNLGELLLLRFDRGGMKVLGRKKICQKTLMHPTVAGARLFAQDNESLYCYDLGDPDTRKQ